MRNLITNDGDIIGSRPRPAADVAIDLARPDGDRRIGATESEHSGPSNCFSNTNSLWIDPTNALHPFIGGTRADGALA